MFLLYTMVYIAIAILPVLSYSVPYVVAGSICLLYALFVFFKYKKYRLMIIFLVLLGAVTGIVMYLNGNKVYIIINEPIRVLRCIIPCFILSDLLKSGKKFKIFLWLFISAILLYIALNTLAELAQNDMIARLLANGEESDELMQYRMNNVAGFEFSYAIGLTFPAWVILFIRAKSVFFKVVSLIFAAFIAYYVISAQYMILFLLCVISLLIIVAVAPKRLYVKIFNIILVIVVLMLASVVLRWLATFNIGDITQRRLLLMADMFDGKITANEISSRFELYKNALNAFFESPIIGQSHSQAAAESHSWLLSVAVSAGVLGVGCVIAELVLYFKYFSKIYIKNGYILQIRNFSFALFIVLAVLNPIQYAYEIFILMFLFVPLTIDLFCNNTGKKYEVGKKNGKISV
ncbi:MAG: hypothetical protein J5911_04375 [Clostridia bacterium]|nr:hypothetical protein [Clostridia bacterium]